LSRRYPQLLRVLARFRTEFAEPVHRAMTLRVRAMRSARRDRVNEAPMRAAHLLRSETGAGAFAFIDSIPRLRLPRAIESPLSGKVALWLARSRGWSVTGTAIERGRAR
jgi:hypothetical protein